MRIKPTLRKNARYMCTFSVKVHLDIEDIVLAMIRERCLDRPLPTSREKAIRVALSQREDVRWLTTEADSINEFGSECVDRTVALFPDMLSESIDLSIYKISK